MPQSSTPCANCGAPTTPRGRESKYGARFCMKPECRAAKQRHDGAVRRVRLGLPPCSVATCYSCGGPVSTSGRKSKTGDRFCMKPKCRVAKQRFSDEERRKFYGIELDDRPCSGCGRKLAPRQVRPSDVSYGRWCSAPSCRKKKAAAIAKHDRELEFFNHGVERLTCPECGRLDARRHHFHPRPAWADGVCTALGTAPPHQLIVKEAREAWPDMAAATIAPVAGKDSGRPEEV